VKEAYKFRGQRRKLVEQLRSKGIEDEAVLEAIGRIPRQQFVEGAFQDQAYLDRALPIQAGQTISQPYTVAYQTQMLQLRKGMKILEIGTGSGYQAAILCEMGMRVFSVERSPSLHQRAKARLASLGYDLYLHCGDGSKGWPRFQPYQRILVTAASPEVPQPLKAQLDMGGKLIIPVGNREVQDMLLVTRRTEHDFHTETLHRFCFVPLLGEYGWEE
jgi:protein-L-isoaspartate(D-aspartate) O-methyltransferase